LAYKGGENLSYEAKLIPAHKERTQLIADLSSAHAFDRYRGWTIMKIDGNPSKYFAVKGNLTTTLRESIDAVKLDTGAL